MDILLLYTMLLRGSIYGVQQRWRIREWNNE
jgi:hypothetical protein